jgi:hypothetical protein
LKEVLKLKKFILLPIEQKFLFLEAIFWAFFFRLVSRCSPFRFWHKFLGSMQKDIETNLGNNNKIVVEKVFRAVRRSSVYMPFKENCLVNAFVVKRMLNRQKINCILYLGIKKENKSILKAHAWVICDNIIVVGSRGSQQYKTLSWFS